MRRPTALFGAGGGDKASGKKPAVTAQEMRRPSRIDKLLSRYKMANPEAEEQAERAAMASVGGRARGRGKKGKRRGGRGGRARSPGALSAASSGGMSIDKAAAAAAAAGGVTPGGETKEERETRVATIKHFGVYSRAQVANVRRMFREIDKDNSGSIDLDEFLQMSTATGSAHLSNHLAAMFSALDSDDSGNVDITELCKVLFSRASATQFADIMTFIHTAGKRAAASKEGTSSKRDGALSKAKIEEIRALFHLYDEDGSGDITLDELRKAMNVDGDRRNRDVHRRRMSKTGTTMVDDLEALLMNADKDGNMTLDEDEFIEWMAASM